MLGPIDNPPMNPRDNIAEIELNRNRFGEKPIDRDSRLFLEYFGPEPSSRVRVLPANDATKLTKNRINVKHKTSNELPRNGTNKPMHSPQIVAAERLAALR